MRTARLRSRAPGAAATTAIALLCAAALAIPAAGLAATTATWKAPVGTRGANGIAVMTAPTDPGTAGTLKLALKGLTASTSYPVKVQAGTCATPGVVLFTGPTQRSTAAGKIAKSLAVPAAKMDAIRQAASTIVRIGSGAKLRCGAFTGGMPAATPTPTPEPSLAPTLALTTSVGAGLTGITSDDTQIWTVDLILGYAYRIDPVKGTDVEKVDYTATLYLTFDAALGEGALWVPTNRLDGPGGTIIRIDTATRTIPARIEVPGRVYGLTVAAGSIWVAQSDPDQLVRIDPAKNTVTKVYPLKAAPSGVAYGNGHAWVITDDSLLEVDPVTSDVTTTALPGQGHGIAFGDGSVWVAIGASGASGSAKLLRIDPATGAIAATIDVAGEPYRIAVGGGYAWLSQTASGGKPIAVAVSTRSNTIAATVTLPENLVGVTIRGRSVWYAGSSDCCGKVVRIDY